MADEKIDTLLDVTAENTTTLIEVQQQTAATAAAVKDARVYMQQVVKNTDWKERGHDLGKIFEEAVQQDRRTVAGAIALLEALPVHALNLRESTEEASKRVENAAQTVREAARATESVASEFKVGWRRWVGAMTLTAALTAALGAFGGYWWATGTLEKADTLDLGAKLVGQYGEDYCGFANGMWDTNSSGNSACIFWQTSKTE